jgi:hypothetical protein
MYPVPGGNRETPFPEWYWERLEKMAEFTLHLTRPDGLATQFGDNDSGRLFKLGTEIHIPRLDKGVSRYAKPARAASVGAPVCLEESDLDHHHLVEGINVFFERKDLAEFAPRDVNAWLVNELAGDVRIATYRKADAQPAATLTRAGSEENWAELLDRFSAVPDAGRRTTIFPADGDDLRNSLELFGYADFGAYVFRSPRLYLAVRCGSVGQGGIGGHAHLDQLTLELVIGDRSLIADPGTYLYTALPARRNAYRSARAHFVPRFPGREPGDLSHNLFRIVDPGNGECLYFGGSGFAGRHNGYGQAVYRLVAIQTDRIIVHDFTESGEALEDPAPEKLPFSPGYGKLCCSERNEARCGFLS